MRWSLQTLLLAGGLLTGKVLGLPTDGDEAAFQRPKYEYIIVGSGPGGGPLAARLAIAGYRVLLLDAGDDQGSSPFYQLPILASASSEYAPMKWDFYVQHHGDLAKQKQDTKMTYRTKEGSLYYGLDPPKDAEPLGILYPRAGTLGGCSAHNALKTVYPHKSDWANIARLTGDRSWEPENMRRYFQKVEDAKYVPAGMVGHGYDGWLSANASDLSIVLQDKKILSLVISASKVMGRSFSGSVVDSIANLRRLFWGDINVDTPERDEGAGVYQIPMSAKDGARIGPREFVVATANAVKEDGTRKYVLDIQLETLVTKIRFSTKKGEKPRAIGVEFLKGKSQYRADPRAANTSSGVPGSVAASREVIISAGAFNTPQLLKLSGVGPANELKSFGIPVLVNLPGVGTNMQDRLEISVVGKSSSTERYSSTKGCTLLKTLDDPCLEKWKKNFGGGDRGVYASNGNVVAVVQKSSVSTGDSDLIISGAPVNFNGYYPGYTANASASGKHFSWVIIKAHTRNNAGTVQLLSKDPRDMPLINFNNFPSKAAHESEKDITALVEGVDLMRKVFQSVTPLDGSYEEVWPGNSISGGKLRELIRTEAWGHHVSCTCPIGKDDDPMAVLDSSFRVRGTLGLRVVDASAFPKIPGMFIVVPIYMMSEKAADVIIAAARN